MPGGAIWKRASERDQAEAILRGQFRYAVGRRSEAGYTYSQWETYPQWQELGVHVRKGERSATLVFWKFFDERESDTLDSDEEEQTGSKRRRIARAYHVFNAMQVDDHISPAVRQMSSSERIAHAEEFVSLIPAVVKHGSDRAFYPLTGD